MNESARTNDDRDAVPGDLPGDLLGQMIDAVTAIVLNEEPDYEPWITFETALRTTETDTPIGRLVESMGLSTFETQVIAVLVGCHSDVSLQEHACRDRNGLSSDGPSAAWLIDALCQNTASRIDAWLSLQPGGHLSPTILGIHKPTPSSPDTIVTLSPSTLHFILGRKALPDHVRSVAGFIHAPFSFRDVIMSTDLKEQVRQLTVHHKVVRHKMADWGGDELMPAGNAVSFLLSGPSGTGKTVFARALATDLEVPLLVVKCQDLPERGAEELLRAIAGQASFYGALVLFDECEALFGTKSPRRGAGLACLDHFFRVVCLLVTNYPDQLDPAVDRRVLLHLPFERPDAEARRQLWEVHIPQGMPISGALDLDIIADRYELTGGQINNAMRVAVSKAVAENPEDTMMTEALLVEGCETQLRSSLESFTTRSTTKLGLDDIVLPPKQYEQIDEFVAAIRNNAKVMNTWGMKGRLMTGRGLVALFDGPPGTGKTLCAEIIAATIGKPLFRVNLPAVVSKWVGETEKHIQAIFREARASRAMLLFDEADSLFAARSSEVKSSNDRHSNMEVNLLLQEIERFDGVAMLTTNHWGVLDKALQRRIQFRVTFEAPEADQREAIWRKLISDRLPLAEDVDLAMLAKRFDFPGGRIKNAILKGAYLAAKRGSAVTQELLIKASLEEASAAGSASRDPEVVEAQRLEREAALAALELKLASKDRGAKSQDDEGWDTD